MFPDEMDVREGSEFFEWRPIIFSAPDIPDAGPDLAAGARKLPWCANFYTVRESPDTISAGTPQTGLSVGLDAARESIELWRAESRRLPAGEGLLSRLSSRPKDRPGCADLRCSCTSNRRIRDRVAPRHAAAARESRGTPGCPAAVTKPLKIAPRNTSQRRPQLGNVEANQIASESRRRAVT